MPEPPAQLRAGGDVLEPQVQGRRLFLQASGPEALYQDPEAILLIRFFISAFKINHYPQMMVGTPIAPRGSPGPPALGAHI